MPEPTVKAVGQRISRWGEGPIWWRNRLLYVDIEGKAVVEFDPLTDRETAWEVGERVGTVVPRKGGGLVIAGDHGFSFFDPDSGNKTPIADPEADRDSSYRFNDGKCDPAGRFWAGSISLAKKTGTAALYMLDAEGKAHRKVGGVTNSNGICWSADGLTMFYIDTPTLKIRAYPFDPASGTLGPPENVVDTEALDIPGVPDGMTIDAEGMLWVAMCHGGCVIRFDPKSGQAIQRIDFPCVETTACAFGGAGLDRIFVTTGLTKGGGEPDAGRLFVVDGVKVRGLPAIPYAG